MPVQAVENWHYLDNGEVRLGVNLNAGGCIGWFSVSGSQDNLLNAYDVGRYVQQSYYGDEDGSDWNGKPWRYNPVQGGSWKNRASGGRGDEIRRDELLCEDEAAPLGHWGAHARVRDGGMAADRRRTGAIEVQDDLHGRKNLTRRGIKSFPRCL